MKDQLSEAVKVAKELEREKNVRCQGVLLPKLREAILSLKNLELEYQGFEDDVEWLEENTVPSGERDVDWCSYLEHVWPDRVDDFIACATDAKDTLDILRWGVENVCELVEKIVAAHGNDVKYYAEQEKKVVASLELCVLLLRTAVETPIEDKDGHFVGEVPLWIRLVRHVALTLPRGVGLDLPHQG